MIKNAMADASIIVEDVKLQGWQEQAEIAAESQVEKEAPAGTGTERDTDHLRHIMKAEITESVMEIAQYPVSGVEMTD